MRSIATYILFAKFQENTTILSYIHVHVFNEMRRKKERRKQGHTNKQGKATVQYTIDTMNIQKNTLLSRHNWI